MNAVGILHLSFCTRRMSLASNIERPLLVFEEGFKKISLGKRLILEMVCPLKVILSKKKPYAQKYNDLRGKTKLMPKPALN